MGSRQRLQGRRYRDARPFIILLPDELVDLKDKVSGNAFVLCYLNAEVLALSPSSEPLNRTVKSMPIDHFDTSELSTLLKVTGGRSIKKARLTPYLATLRISSILDIIRLHSRALGNFSLRSYSTTTRCATSFIYGGCAARALHIALFW